MNAIKNSPLFRTISLILIVTFITLDIAYAYPPEHRPVNSTLAAPSNLQANPVDPYSALRMQFEGAIMPALKEIGENALGGKVTGGKVLSENYSGEVTESRLRELLKETGMEMINIVPVEYLKEQNPERLQDALDKVGFKGNLPSEGVVFVLFKKGDNRLLFTMAKRGTVSPADLPGIEWSDPDLPGAGDYLIMGMPEDYAGKVESLQAVVEEAEEVAHSPQSVVDSPQMGEDPDATPAQSPAPSKPLIRGPKTIILLGLVSLLAMFAGCSTGPEGAASVSVMGQILIAVILHPLITSAILIGGVLFFAGVFQVHLFSSKSDKYLNIVSLSSIIIASMLLLGFLELTLYERSSSLFEVIFFGILAIPASFICGAIYGFIAMLAAVLSAYPLGILTRMIPSYIFATVTPIRASKNRDAYIRKVAAKKLGRIKDLKAVHILIGLLDDADADVCIAAINSLRNLNDPISNEHVAKLLYSENFLVRCAAAKSLERGESIVEYLVYDDMYLKVARALVGIPDKNIDFMRPYLQDVAKGHKYIPLSKAEVQYIVACLRQGKSVMADVTPYYYYPGKYHTESHKEKVDPGPPYYPHETPPPYVETTVYYKICDEPEIVIPAKLTVFMDDLVDVGAILERDILRAGGFSTGLELSNEQTTDQNIALAVDNIGNARAIKKLIKSISRYKWYSRTMGPDDLLKTVEALAKIGKPAVPILIDALTHKKPIVRFAAMETLLIINDSSISALNKALTRVHNTPFNNPRCISLEQWKILLDCVNTGHEFSIQYTPEKSHEEPVVDHSNQGRCSETVIDVAEKLEIMPAEKHNVGTIEQRDKKFGVFKWLIVGGLVVLSMVLAATLGHCAGPEGAAAGSAIGSVWLTIKNYINTHPTEVVVLACILILAIRSVIKELKLFEKSKAFGRSNIYSSREFAANIGIVRNKRISIWYDTQIDGPQTAARLLENTFAQNGATISKNMTGSDVIIYIGRGSGFMKLKYTIDKTPDDKDYGRHKVIDECGPRELTSVIMTETCEFLKKFDRGRSLSSTLLVALLVELLIPAVAWPAGPDFAIGSAVVSIVMRGIFILIIAGLLAIFTIILWKVIMWSIVIFDTIRLEISKKLPEFFPNISISTARVRSAAALLVLSFFAVVCLSGPEGLGLYSSLGSLFTTMKSFMSIHPGITFFGAVGLIMLMALLMWRIFFPLSFYKMLRYSSSFEIREHGRESLIRLGAPAVPYFLDRLHYDSYESGRARNSLQTIGDRATGQLVIGLRHQHPKSRLGAAETLDYIDWQPTNQEEEIYYLAAKREWNLLVNIGIPAVPYLLRLMKYKYPVNDEIRENALRVLGEIKDPATISHIIEFLEHKTARVRLAAIMALGNTKDPRAIEPLKRSLQDASRQIRLSAAEALGDLDLKPASDEERLHYLIASQNWQELIKTGSPAIPSLIGLLGDVEGAYNALVSLGTPSVPSLIETLNNPSGHIRSLAAKALGEIKDQRAVEPLIKILGDTHWPAQSEASEALVKIGTPAIDYLVNRLEDKNTSLQEMVVQILGNIDDPRTIESLIKSAGKKRYRARVAATKSLSGKKDPRVVDALLGLLKEKNARVRFYALKGLYGSSDPRLFDHIMKALIDKDSDVRSIAALILLHSNNPDLSFMSEYLYVIAHKGPDYYVALNPKDIEHILSSIKNGKDVEALYAPWHQHESFPYITNQGGQEIDMTDTTIIPAKLVIDKTNDERRTTNDKSDKKSGVAKWLTVGALVLLSMVLVATLGHCAGPEGAAVSTSWLGSIYMGVKSFVISSPWESLAIVAFFGFAAYLILWRYVHPISWNIGLLSSDQEGAADKAEKALIDIGVPAVPKLIRALKNHSAATRYRAARALGDIGDVRAIESLRILLDDDDDLVRAWAKYALNKINTPREGLDDGVQKEKPRATGKKLLTLLIALVIPTIALGASPEGAAGAGLTLTAIEAFVKTYPVLTGMIGIVFVIAAFFAVRKAMAVSALLRIKYSNNPHIRAFAASDLGYLKYKKGIIPLIKLLNDPAAIVRYQAAKALLEMNDKRISFMAPYLKLMVDNNPERVPDYKFYDPLSDDDIANLVAFLEDGSLISEECSKVLKTNKKPMKMVFKMAPGQTAPSRQPVTTDNAGVAPDGPSPDTSLPLAPGSATELFDLVEEALIGRRAEFIEAANAVRSSRDDLGRLFADDDPREFNQGMASAYITRKTARIIETIESLEEEQVDEEAKTRMEMLKSSLLQFEADGGIASIIAKAKSAKKEGQRLLIGLETEWIPALGNPKSLQTNAITSLIKEIEDLADALESMGLDDSLEIIRGGQDNLAGAVLDRAWTTNTNMHNIIVMASTDTIYSDSFSLFRNAPADDRPFLAGIDPTELKRAYGIHGESYEHQINIQLTRLLYLTCELAAGKNPVGQYTPIYTYNESKRIVIFLPTADVKDYDKVLDNYEGEKTALSAA